MGERLRFACYICEIASFVKVEVSLPELLMKCTRMSIKTSGLAYETFGLDWTFNLNY